MIKPVLILDLGKLDASYLPQIYSKSMVLTNKEKTIALISNAIAVYSLYQERGNLPENTSLIDFILKAVPEDIKPEISMELIDEIFGYVSSAHNS